MKKFSIMEKSDALSLYLKDINKVPLMSAEEEKECVEKASKGDKKAKEKLIKSNLRFVVKVAKKYRNSGLSFSDLISEGNIGLTIAAERFDGTKGVRFISYAVWWIRQTILKAISEKTRLIHLPVNRINELSFLEEKMDGGEKDIEKIAQDINIDRALLGSIMNVSAKPISFSEPLKNGDGDATISDVIKDEANASPECEAINATLKEEIRKMLSTLSNREAAILKYRFGLEGEEPHSLVEVGMTFNLTKERIRQIEQKSIEKLKNIASAQGLESYVA